MNLHVIMKIKKIKSRNATVVLYILKLNLKEWVLSVDFKRIKSLMQYSRKRSILKFGTIWKKTVDGTSRVQNIKAQLGLGNVEVKKEINSWSF